MQVEKKAVTLVFGTQCVYTMHRYGGGGVDHQFEGMRCSRVAETESSWADGIMAARDTATTQMYDICHRAPAPTPPRTYCCTLTLT